MQEREQQTELVPVQLPGGKQIYVQALAQGGLEQIGNIPIPFKEVADVIESISTSIVTALKKAKPRKAIVEFGLEIGLESGHLTTLLVKGTSTANLKIALEWGDIDSNDDISLPLP